MSISDKITAIDGKLQQLLKQHANVQKEYSKLLKEHETLLLQQQQSEIKIQQLSQKLEALSLTSSGLNDDVKKDLEKRITTYLKEVDTCLTLLNG